MTGDCTRYGRPAITATLDKSAIIVAVMVEQDLERIVKFLARMRHLPAFHVINSRRRVTLTGWPDWTIVGTRVIFRELKRERGKVSADQAAVGEAITAAGGDWAIWRPSDLKSGRIETELDTITIPLDGFPHLPPRTGPDTRVILPHCLPTYDYHALPAYIGTRLSNSCHPENP